MKIEGELRRFWRWTRRFALKDHWLARETITICAARSAGSCTYAACSALVDERSCFAGSLLLEMRSPATGSTISPAARACAQHRAQRSDLRLPNGKRRVASTAFLRRDAEARVAENKHRQAPRRGRRLPLASPPAFPMISTGRTKSALRSRTRIDEPGALTAMEANLRFDGPGLWPCLHASPPGRTDLSSVERGRRQARSSLRQRRKGRVR